MFSPLWRALPSSVTVLAAALPSVLVKSSVRFAGMSRMVGIVCRRCVLNASSPCGEFGAETSGSLEGGVPSFWRTFRRPSF